MKNNLLKLTAYIGLLGGTAVMAGFLLYAPTFYPELAEQQLLLSVVASFC